MLILHSMTDFTAPGCVVALGTFDGVHLGHAHLIQTACALAREKNLPAAALTFDRHPLSLIRPDAVPAALTPLPEKERLLAALGLDILIEQPFTAAFAAQEADAFLESLCAALRPAAVVIGYNHTFGRRGLGSAALLESRAQTLGCEAVVLPPFEMDGEPVSSTRIRALLANGQRSEAERLAGHPL